MREKWTLSLVLTGPNGERHEKRIDTDAVSIDGPVFAAPLPDPFGTFETVGDALKRRSFRSDRLQRQAVMLGKALAEHLEDLEGWHGEDRREKVEMHARLTHPGTPL